VIAPALHEASDGPLLSMYEVGSLSAGVDRQGAGRLRLTQPDQGQGEPAGGGERVGVIGAQDRPPTGKQRFADDSAGVDVAVGLQVAKRPSAPTVGRPKWGRPTWRWRARAE
jgi:hypothetical protein